MSIELSHDELLVLYDLLHRLEDVEEIFEDPSEQEVLWHIQTHRFCVLNAAKIV